MKRQKSYIKKRAKVTDFDFFTLIPFKFVSVFDFLSHEFVLPDYVLHSLCDSICCDFVESITLKFYHNGHFDESSHRWYSIPVCLRVIYDGDNLCLYWRKYPLTNKHDL